MIKKIDKSVDYAEINTYHDFCAKKEQEQKKLLKKAKTLLLEDYKNKLTDKWFRDEKGSILHIKEVKSIKIDKDFNKSQLVLTYTSFSEDDEFLEEDHFLLMETLKDTNQSIFYINEFENVSPDVINELKHKVLNFICKELDITTSKIF